MRGEIESGSFLHWKPHILISTVHSSFFPTFDFFKQYVAFCTGFDLLTPIFMLPCIIMGLPIFVIAEWIFVIAGGYFLSPRWLLT